MENENQKECRNAQFKNYLMVKQDETHLNPFKHIDDYLKNNERQHISKVFGLVELIKERPDVFIKLMVKAAPHTSDTIESDLYSFYQKTFQINDLVNSLPTYETPQQKLAGIFVELLTWAQVRGRGSSRSSGRAQVGPQVREDLRYLQVASDFEAGNLREVLKPTIEYLFTAYHSIEAYKCF